MVQHLPNRMRSVESSCSVSSGCFWPNPLTIGWRPPKRRSPPSRAPVAVRRGPAVVKSQGSLATWPTQIALPARSDPAGFPPPNRPGSASLRSGDNNFSSTQTQGLPPANVPLVLRGRDSVVGIELSGRGGPLQIPVLHQGQHMSGELDLQGMLAASQTLTDFPPSRALQPQVEGACRSAGSRSFR